MEELDFRPLDPSIEHRDVASDQRAGPNSRESYVPQALSGESFAELFDGIHFDGEQPTDHQANSRGNQHV